VNILISSYVYAPSIGGIETSTQILAREFVKRGHEVKLLTQTPHQGEEVDSFEILRKPQLQTWRALLKWCDVFWHNHISLRTVPYCSSKPWFVTHQTWLEDRSLRSQLIRPIKEWACAKATNFTLSRAMSHALPFPSKVIGNPYDDTVFREYSRTRDRDCIFVGRLVSDKGLDVLIRALHLLKERGVSMTLTVVGTGPEESSCRKMVEKFGLQDQIRWRGGVHGHALAELYNQHKLCIVPSRWSEPFGIVALEAIACGCFVIASESGGLPEAVDGCGLFFPNGDERALADILHHQKEQYVITPSAQTRSKHLAQFTPEAVASRYEEEFLKGCHR